MKKHNNLGLPDPIIDKSKSKEGKYVASFFYWKDKDRTIKGHSNTKQYIDKKRALTVAKEKQELKSNHESEDKIELADKLITEALKDYIKYLEEKMSIKTAEKASTYKGLWNDAGSILRNHTPKSIKEKHVCELEDDDFELWMKHIDKKDIKGKLHGLSGSRVSSYRRVLLGFIDFLETNDYLMFDKKLNLRLENELKSYKIKDKEVGKRKGVYVPTYLDMRIFCDGYNRETFYGDYRYCFFKILTMSGVRISEMISLRWKNIDFDSGLIHIQNSINNMEMRDNVMYRLSIEEDETKNDSSTRYVPMMEMYYKMFKNYKYNYQKHFNLTDEQMLNAFCFPKLQSRYKDKRDCGPYFYQTQRWIRDEIEIQCELTGIPYFPAESLRHCCAKFFAKDLCLLEYEAYDLFGHTDNKMLKNVYAQLKEEEKAKRLTRRRPGLFHRDLEYELKQKQLKEENLKNFEKGDKLDSEIFREQFLATRAKINHLIDSGVIFYTYNDIEEPIIERLIKQYKYDEVMTFIREEI